jgi:hypothetical protein
MVHVCYSFIASAFHFLAICVIVACSEIFISVIK